MFGDGAFDGDIGLVIKNVNLAEVVSLMIGLAKFLSFASEVRFEPVSESAPVVLTCPFRLQNLIYQVLVFAFKSAGPNGRIRVVVDPQPNGSVQIGFSGYDSGDGQKFATEKVNNLAASIGVEIREAIDIRSLNLMVPENFETAS